MEEEPRKKRAVASAEEPASPDRVESKPRAVSESPKKKKQRRNPDQDSLDGKPEADGAREDLSSIFEEEVKTTENETEGEAESETEDNSVNADTVMGFPSCPNLTNREIVAQKPDFVRWARRTSEDGNAFGNLLRFLEWLDSEEGKKEEMKSRGKEEMKRRENWQLDFGQHRGKTYRWVACNDPSYHLRFMAMNPTLARKKLQDYMEYFNYYGDAYEAEYQYRDNYYSIAGGCGPYFPF